MTSSGVVTTGLEAAVGYQCADSVEASENITANQG